MTPIMRTEAWAGAYRIVPSTANTFDPPRILLLGEDNPQSAKPEHALWPIPSTGKSGCAGKNLQSKILGVPHATYYSLWRTNLCNPTWNLNVATARAAHLLFDHHPWTTIVLLGRKVAKRVESVVEADIRIQPWTWHPVFSVVVDDLGDKVDRVLKLVAMPHPSGLTRDWNDPASYVRAQRLMSEVAPEVSWGSIGRIPVPEGQV